MESLLHAILLNDLGEHLLICCRPLRVFEIILGSMPAMPMWDTEIKQTVAKPSNDILLIALSLSA